jgi:hypothetical protein
VTRTSYEERLRVAGSDAHVVDGHLEELLTLLPKVERKYGQGSMKLDGFGGSSLVFQPAPTNKPAAAGLVVQLRGDIGADQAARIRKRVSDVGGKALSTFNIVPTRVAATEWVRVRDHLLVPFLRDGR